MSHPLLPDGEPGPAAHDAVALADQLGRLVAAPAERLDDEITATLRTLTRLVGMDRVTVWQAAGAAPGDLRLTHMVTLVALPPLPDELSAATTMPWLLARVAAGQLLALGDVAQLPPAAEADRRFLAFVGTRALLLIPLVDPAGHLAGCVSFASETPLDRWHEATVATCRIGASVLHAVLARRRADEAARAERATLHAILDSSAADIIWCVDLERHALLTWNAAFEAFVRAIGGAPPRAGATVTDLLPQHPEIGARWATLYARALREGAVITEVRPSYTPRRFQVQVRPVHREGAAIGVVVVARDVTDQRRIEGEVRQLQRAVEQAPVTVVITDTTGAIEYVNPQFTALSGYALDEVRGHNPRLLKSGRMTDDEYRTLWRTIGAGGAWHGEFHNRAKDGRLYWERAVIAPVRDAAGAITHYVRVGEDISEAKRAAAELARVQEQLLQSQKMDAIGRLAGGIAHDFNNLLTVINAFTADAIDQLGAGNPIAADLQDVVKAGDRAAELTRQLLAFSRQQPRQPRVVDVGAVLLDAEKLLRRVLREDITLVIGQPTRPALVLADPSQLHQVILNLTVNARDAMPRGGELVIHVRQLDLPAPDGALPAGPCVGLKVRDTGEGIPPELRGRVFEPFFTTKPHGKGTGLGLATVLGIVSQSGGAVRLDSVVGEGTTVRILLPRASAEPAGPPAPAPPRPAPRGATVLVAEDDPDVRKVLARILRGCGYDVVLAADGAEALALAHPPDRRVDLLITDVVMPGVSGLELARRLRATRPRLPVLFTSGFPDVPHEELEALAHAPLLPKPYTVAAVADAVHRALARA